MGNEEENKEPMWYEVYRELAELLVNVEPKEFYEKCMRDGDFQNQHNWTKVLRDNKHWNATNESRVDWDNHHNSESKQKFQVESFDPIQIFVSFNGFGMTDKSRIEKINLYFRLLDSEKQYNKINFSGCPSPMMVAIISMRHPEEIKVIWEYFSAVMKKGQEAVIDLEIFNNDYFGISQKFFTIFLFWIDSKNFLPLDKNTEALFETNNQTLPQSKWSDYIDFLKLQDTDIYQIIARISWNCSFDSLEKSTKDLLESTFKIKKCPNKSLKIIAIKALEGCNPDFLKGLKEEETYLFDKAYSIQGESVIYHKEKDIQLFNQDELQVNINAIVGKNGTGKSTLVELLLAVLNNVTHQQIKKDCIEGIKGLKVELIFEDLHLYKVKINDEDIKLFEYTNDSVWKEIKKLTQKKFFYNILVNYSIHSLDTTNNDWLKPYFQSDSKDCQKDIILEPVRENGNINIQKEEETVKKRLIVNLLEPELEDDSYSFRQLTNTYRANKIISENKDAHGNTKDQFRKFLDEQETYQEEGNYRYYNVELLSTTIQDLKADDKSIEDFIPENYFLDIRLDNNIKFSQLSSGEKQKIYSINSIVYHIQRLDKDKKRKYKHINLILDEIELYFHPELQRTYINDIIKAIKKVGTENILGINITFITHSPFILSDIPENKILFLDKEDTGKTISKNIVKETFGANIHTLLSDNFFMSDGLMGEFAKGKINEIKEFYAKVIKEEKTEEKTDENIVFYKEHQNKFWQIQEIIGEPFLQKIVKNQLEEIELILLDKNEAIDKEIARLEALKESSKYA